MVINDGFDSASIHHFHFQAIDGRDGRTVVKAKLCRDCYLEDYNVVFPDRHLILDELPKQIIYV